MKSKTISTLIVVVQFIMTLAITLFIWFATTPKEGMEFISKLSVLPVWIGLGINLKRLSNEK